MENISYDLIVCAEEIVCVNGDNADDGAFFATE